MAGYEAFRELAIAILVVTFVLVTITGVWIATMIYRRRFGLFEMMLFVSWASIVCAILVRLWSD